MKGAKRQNASGRSWQIRMIVPKHLKPVRNAIYRIRLTRRDSNKKVLICIEIRDFINRC